MGEFLALVATGLELLRGRRSRLQTARAREISCTEKKPESSMLVEGCCTICEKKIPKIIDPMQTKTHHSYNLYNFYTLTY